MNKLERLKAFVPKHQNGAKLKKVEVSEESNVIPEGSLHKNKHDIDLDGITQKGIPVGHLTTNEVVDNTFDIKQAKGDFVQDAEIEESEVIFSKDLTDIIEENRQKWHDSEEKDDKLLIEMGKRLTKELLINTEDNTDLIPKIESQL